MIKLDMKRREWAERIVAALSSDEDALRKAVYAMIEAEEALAVQSSYRTQDQQKSTIALTELRAVMQY